MKQIDDGHWRDGLRQHGPIQHNGRRVSYGAELDDDFVPKPARASRESVARPAGRLRIRDFVESLNDVPDESVAASAVAGLFGALATAAARPSPAARESAVTQVSVVAQVSDCGNQLTAEQIGELTFDANGFELPNDALIASRELIVALRGALARFAMPGELARLTFRRDEPSLPELAALLEDIGSMADVQSMLDSRSMVDGQQRWSGASRAGVHSEETSPRAERSHRASFNAESSPTEGASANLGDRLSELSDRFKGKTAAGFALVALTIAFAGSLMLGSSRGASAEVDPNPEPVASTSAGATAGSREALTVVAPAPAPTPNWRDRMMILDDLRTGAFVIGAPGLLRSVNAPDSSAAKQDLAAIAELQRMGAHVADLQTTISDVRPIKVSDTQVQLEVTDSRSGYAIVSNTTGKVVARQPERPSKTWIVTLKLVDDAWLTESSRER